MAQDFGWRKIWLKPFVFGVLASIFLALAYFVVLSYLNSFSHALLTFSQLWYFMVPLIAGFGFQIMLFTYIRNAHNHSLCDATERAAVGGVSAASGTVSVTSMVACCLHHVADLLPFVGFSAAALFISQFQSFFLLLGVFSSVAGVFLMLGIIQKHSLYSEQQFFLSKILKQDIGLAVKSILVLAAIVLGTSFASAL